MDLLKVWLLEYTGIRDVACGGTWRQDDSVSSKWLSHHLEASGIHSHCSWLPYTYHTCSCNNQDHIFLCSWIMFYMHSSSVCHAILFTIAWCKDCNWVVHLSRALYLAIPVVSLSSSNTWFTWSILPWIVLQTAYTQLFNLHSSWTPHTHVIWGVSYILISTRQRGVH